MRPSKTTRRVMAALSLTLCAAILSTATTFGYYRQKAKAAAAMAEQQRITALHAAAERELAEVRRMKRDLSDKLARIAERDATLEAIRVDQGHGVVHLDSDGRVVVWNKALESWTGWTADEMIGQTLERVMAPDDYRRHAANYGAWLRDSESTVKSIFLHCHLIPRDKSQPPIPVRVGARKIETIGDGIPPIAIGLVDKESGIVDLTAGDPPPE